MKFSAIKTLCNSLLAIGGIFVAFGTAVAAKTDTGANEVKPRVVGGTIACGGYHSSRDNYTVLGLNNWDDTNAIVIERLVVYNGADGSIRFDTSRGDVPHVSFKTELNPHMRTRFISHRFFADGENIDLQVVFYWRSKNGEPVRSLGIGGTRFITGKGMKHLRCRIISEY